MYKAKPQFSTSKTSLTPAPPSKKTIKTPLPSIHKENLLLDTNSIFRNPQATLKHPNNFPSKSEQYSLMPEIIELKLTQPLKSTHQSKRKLLRPWAAKPVDFNKETLKADAFRISLEKTKEWSHHRRGSVRDSLLRSKELESCNSELKPADECIETVRFAKAISARERSQTSRDKTASCKIALKKSLFPINPRQYEQQRIAEHFQKEEDLLSTIQKEEEDNERFISVDSYTKLVF